jgi:hypothetical protein
MKKTLLVSSLFVATALVSQSALAEVRFRAGAGTSTYELGGDYTHAKATYTPTNVGMTFAWGSTTGGYVDVSYSGGSGKHDGWATANSPTTICGGTSCGNLASPEEDFKRQDYALTGGVVFINQNNGIAGNVYIGIKGGTTTLNAKNAGLPWTEEKLTTTGMIIGGGASFPIAGGSAGSVGVNLGIGIMGANWKDNNSPAYDQDADIAVGGSLGASYTFPFSSNFGVIVDYKYQSYSYTFCADCANPFTVSEKFSTLGGSLYAKF